MKLSTAKKRILVGIAPGSRTSLASLAKARKEPLATVAARMIDIGLELEEDVALADRAHERAMQKGARYIAHSSAWKKLLK